MRRAIKYSLILGLIIFMLAASITAADKPLPRIEKVGDYNPQELRTRPRLSTADSCVARNDGGIIYLINNWATGNELYKNYIDPELSCPQPYPYLVTEIYMPMHFLAATPLNVAVDIERADTTNPDCPIPGELLSISSVHEFQIPDSGLYNISIQLDTPILVDGPFFAGFFIANLLPDSAAAAVTSDDNITATCISYNIWDDSIGFVDLISYGFPGQLVLYASGVPGGSGSTPPEPEIKIVTPLNNQDLYGQTEIWAVDTTNSEIIDYFSFEYSTGGDYTEIGKVYSNLSMLRDDIFPTGNSNGYLQSWDFSLFAEGTYSIRVIAFDTLGRSDTAEISVDLEPTPPIPTVVDPDNGLPFCSDLNLLFSSSDENLNNVNVYLKNGQLNYSAGLDSLSINNFGVGYSAPIAAALGIKLWSDRNYPFLMREGFDVLPLDTFVVRMADLFKITENNGALDELVINGLHDFNLDKGNALKIDYKRLPDYFKVRSFLEEQEKAVMLALGGTQGIWVAVDGFSGLKQNDGSYLVSISDPLTGTIISIPMINNGSSSSVFYNNNWLTVDLCLAFGIVNWNPTKTLLGTDNNALDGWSYFFDTTGLTEGDPYFFITEGIDADNNKGYGSLFLEYNCTLVYTGGDYNNDGLVNIVDLQYLVDYFLSNGPAPIGGAWRADANCDHIINITDIIYYLNSLFGYVDPPCN